MAPRQRYQPTSGFDIFRNLDTVRTFGSNAESSDPPTQVSNDRPDERPQPRQFRDAATGQAFGQAQLAQPAPAESGNLATMSASLPPLKAAIQPDATTNTEETFIGTHQPNDVLKRPLHEAFGGDLESLETLATPSRMPPTGLFHTTPSPRKLHSASRTTSPVKAFAPSPELGHVQQESSSLPDATRVARSPQDLDNIPSDPSNASTIVDHSLGRDAFVQSIMDQARNFIQSNSASSTSTPVQEPYSTDKSIMHTCMTKEQIKAILAISNVKKRAQKFLFAFTGATIQLHEPYWQEDKGRKIVEAVSNWKERIEFDTVTFADGEKLTTVRF